LPSGVTGPPFEFSKDARLGACPDGSIALTVVPSGKLKEAPLPSGSAVPWMPAASRPVVIWDWLVGMAVPPGVTTKSAPLPASTALLVLRAASTPRPALIATPAPPGTNGVATATASATIPTASSAAAPKFPSLTLLTKLTTPTAKLATSKTVSATRPSGSVNLYGLLLAYQYRLKFPPLTESAATGSMLRKRPTTGS